mmetsp:Transcript_10002/g.15653  ORF Transcript_10002/g.15653 Transcript_10002/m.15653 type:complete len:89 (+) Transcript_10002:39-305(+)
MQSEGDIVEYVEEGNSAVKLGMVMTDSVDGEVKVKELLRREGDGEYDEWKCFLDSQTVELEIPAYSVRYIGSCTSCTQCREEEPEVIN